MTPLQEAAKEICDFLTRQGWRFCVVVGIAATRWGEPRTTEDVDLCLLTGLAEERRFINTLLTTFAVRRPDAADFAESARVLLISASNGVGIDIALGWTPFEEQMVARASNFQLGPNLTLPIASPEDVVVTKALAGRPLDWIDVQRLLARQRGKLDWEYIRRELGQLCELTEVSGPVDKLEHLKAQIDAE
ncbi:MAG TPA: nucleotidyl transferase AbiEii/AbiGii toxin family protein [Pirellulales bacterium]|jgi:hypothetical protein|nr:nucleotidyl transferase AbiEii/AbiGii toxin family protein [Pirellulales bacterium]